MAPEGSDEEQTHGYPGVLREAYLSKIPPKVDPLPPFHQQIRDQAERLLNDPDVLRVEPPPIAEQVHADFTKDPISRDFEVTYNPVTREATRVTTEVFAVDPEQSQAGVAPSGGSVVGSA